VSRAAPAAPGSTMKIPVLAGRDFQESDGPGSPAVAVINQAFAEAAFGGRNPLGQHVVVWESTRRGQADRPARDGKLLAIVRTASSRYLVMMKDESK
jgi:hypothetical protein